MPLLLKGLIADIVGEINASIAENRVPRDPVRDPTDSILLVLNTFLDWHNDCRQPLHLATEVGPLCEKTKRMQHYLKTVFPSKTGELFKCVYICTHICVQCT